MYFYTYSSWKGRAVFMEDLYVMPEFRGNCKTLVTAFENLLNNHNIFTNTFPKSNIKGFWHIGFQAHYQTLQF